MYYIHQKFSIGCFYNGLVRPNCFLMQGIMTCSISVQVWNSSQGLLELKPQLPATVIDIAHDQITGSQVFSTDSVEEQS